MTQWCPMLWYDGWGFDVCRSYSVLIIIVVNYTCYVWYQIAWRVCMSYKEQQEQSHGQRETTLSTISRADNTGPTPEPGTTGTQPARRNEGQPMGARNRTKTQPKPEPGTAGIKRWTTVDSIVCAHSAGHKSFGRVYVVNQFGWFWHACAPGGHSNRSRLSRKSVRVERCGKHAKRNYVTNDPCKNETSQRDPNRHTSNTDDKTWPRSRTCACYEMVWSQLTKNGHTAYIKYRR